MHRTALLGLLLVFGTTAVAADWPQWQGLDRTAVSKETGLLQDWAAGQPKLLWTTENLGEGFSTPSVVGGKIYGLGTRNGKDGVWALNEKDGKEVWFTPIDDAQQANPNNGPSGTPTFHDGKLYAVGTKGKVACLDAATGKSLWQVDFKKDFGGNMPRWGFCESPLIDGDKVIVTPGGPEAALVALDKTSGKVIWKARLGNRRDGAQYSSAIVADVHGVRQYIQFMRGGVVGVAAEDGKFLWRYDAPANGTANCSTPLYHDGHVFAASGYGTGGGLAKLTKKADGTWEATQVYFTKDMKNHHGGMILVDGHIYGSNEGQLVCLGFLDGKVKWSSNKPGKGSIAAADGRIYYRNESGRNSKTYLVELTPKEFVEHGALSPPKASGKSAWPHPVIANGRLYIRDQDFLFCYDIQAQ